jgi:inner membrane transporter RhtA
MHFAYGCARRILLNMAIETSVPGTTAEQSALPATSGVGLMVGSALSNQSGAAIASTAFPVLGPALVVAVRQWVAAVVLLAIGRPNLRAFTAAQWRLIFALAVVFATMNLTLYTAIQRLGLGLGVTLEFLGPLAVAIAGSRRPRDLGCAIAAAPAVAVLMRPQATTDYAGIGLGLLAAACWGSYILLNRSVGKQLPGAQAAAAASAVSATLYLPVGIVLLAHHHPTLKALACAAVAGVLSSAVPFAVDLKALRKVPAHRFGTFMSVNPVFAALIGSLALGQRLDVLSWLAIVIIVAANAVCTAGGDAAGGHSFGASRSTRRASVVAIRGARAEDDGKPCSRDYG